MGNSVKGSIFSFGDNNLFVTLPDVGGRKNYTAEQNNQKIYAALEALATKGGGVLVIPHGFKFVWTLDSVFPPSPDPLAILIITGNQFASYSNTGHTTEMGPIIKFNGQFVNSHYIVVPAEAGIFQFPDYLQNLIINSEIDLASWNIYMPQQPKESMSIQIFTKHAITNLNLYAAAGTGFAAGHTITTLPAGGSIEYTYDLATTSWYRLR